MVTAGGTLTETAAVLEYIAPNMLPRDAFESAKHREISYYLAATMHINHAHKLRGYRWADLETSYEDMRAKVPQTMAESCAYVEDVIVGPYIFGAQFTLADAYLFVITQWLAGDGVEIQNYPKLAQLQRSVAARPSVARIAEKGLL